MISYYSTNNPSGPRADFTTAFLQGLASDYGLYMMARQDLPHFTAHQLNLMRDMEYSQIAMTVLWPFLDGSIPRDQAEELIRRAYDPKRITTRMQHVLETLSIMWLTGGPSLSFKDYAALPYAALLDFILEQRGLYRLIFVTTSGDTGAAIASAVRGFKRLAAIIFFPLGEISSLQRLQMDTVGDNTFAIGYRGDFDVGQEMAKRFLRDTEFCRSLFGRPDMFTSANSISVGRLLPQMVYPFYAYSRLPSEHAFLACVPSGNFGDMMGTILARSMGLPIQKVICGVNGNETFPRFLKTGQYRVDKTHRSPSSAMNVSHPSNIARLFDFYGGHICDERNAVTQEVVHQGVVLRPPDLEAMRRDIFSMSVADELHYTAMNDAYTAHSIVLDPHGAVGWHALEKYRAQSGDTAPAVIYETADPAKFPEAVRHAIGVLPAVPKALAELDRRSRRIIELQSEPDRTADGKLAPSHAQIEEAKAVIAAFSITFD